jgi:predicted nucleic acid-binding protein
MSVFVIVALVLVAIAIIVLLLKKKAAEARAEARAYALDEKLNEEMLQMLAQTQPEPQRQAKAVTKAQVESRARLTDTQKVALHSAFGHAIYADDQSQRTPYQRELYSPRTIGSLVKRGFLEADEAGGYVITAAGEDELRRSSGF